TPPDVASAVERIAANQSGDIAALQEPEMIEVWRPGRSEGRWRGRSRQHTKNRQAQKQPAAAESAQDARNAVQQADSSSPPSEPSGERGVQTRPRQHGRKRRKPEHWADRAQRERPGPKRFERREKSPDPNSPFAKLAGLKAQLEADAKERPKE